MTPQFTINFDYRCPFARNANEHVLAAVAGGADYDVKYLSFSLTQVHVEEGAPSIWDDMSKRPDLIALTAGIVVRDKMPEQFPEAHRLLFAARHDDGLDLREEKVVIGALERAGIDAGVVLKEIDDGWPIKTAQEEYESSVRDHAVFGVPTFVVDNRAVFVRLMTRPAGDTKLAWTTIDHVLSLITDQPELNEFKYTSVSR